MTSIATNVINKNYANLHGFCSKDPSARDPYMTIDVEETWVAYYESTPRFKKDPKLSKMDKYALYDYFPFLGDLPELFTKQCPNK